MPISLNDSQAKKSCGTVKLINQDNTTSKRRKQFSRGDYLNGACKIKKKKKLHDQITLLKKAEALSRSQSNN